MKLTKTHTINAPVDLFFDRIIFGREYNERLHLDQLGLKAFAFERLEVDDDVKSKRVRVTPKQDAPAVVKKLLSGELSYVEEGRWTRQSGVYRFTTTTSIASDRISISGEVSATPLGPGRCERTIAMEVVVRVPLIGKKVEQFVGEQLAANFDKGVEFTNRWIGEQDWE